MINPRLLSELSPECREIFAELNPHFIKTLFEIRWYELGLDEDIRKELESEFEIDDFVEYGVPKHLMDANSEWQLIFWFGAELKGRLENLYPETEGTFDINSPERLWVWELPDGTEVVAYDDGNGWLHIVEVW